VIDPAPVGNVTEPVPCECPVAGGPTLPIDDTSAQPVQPGDNTTIIVEQPAPGTPEEGGDGNGNGNGNGNGDGGG
jgi:hypothetical protein